MLIDLIRHGEPVGGRRYRGQLDDPLSDRGWKQMWEAVADHSPWDVIISSPLKRCADFAQELSQRHTLPLEEDERLMEIGFGEWEGRTADEIMEKDSQILWRFYQDPVHHRPPGAEHLTDFQTRITTVWNDLLQHHVDRHLLIVAHAGVIRMIFVHVLGMPVERMFSIQVPNAGISRIRIDGTGELRLAQLVSHVAPLC